MLRLRVESIRVLFKKKRPPRRAPATLVATREGPVPYAASSAVNARGRAVGSSPTMAFCGSRSWLFVVVSTAVTLAEDLARQSWRRPAALGGLAEDLARLWWR